MFNIKPVILDVSQEQLMMLYPFKLLTILYYYNIVIEVEIVEFLKQNAWKGIFNLKQNCMMSYVFFFSWWLYINSSRQSKNVNTINNIKHQFFLSRKTFSKQPEVYKHNFKTRNGRNSQLAVHIQTLHLNHFSLSKKHFVY